MRLLLHLIGKRCGGDRDQLANQPTSAVSVRTDAAATPHTKPAKSRRIVLLSATMCLQGFQEAELQRSRGSNHRRRPAVSRSMRHSFRRRRRSWQCWTLVSEQSPCIQRSAILLHPCVPIGGRSATHQPHTPAEEKHCCCSMTSNSQSRAGAGLDATSGTIGQSEHHRREQHR